MVKLGSIKKIVDLLGLNMLKWVQNGRHDLEFTFDMCQLHLSYKSDAGSFSPRLYFA